MFTCATTETWEPELLRGPPPQQQHTTTTTVKTVNIPTPTDVRCSIEAKNTEQFNEFVSAHVLPVIRGMVDRKDQLCVTTATIVVSKPYYTPDFFLFVTNELKKDWKVVFAPTSETTYVMRISPSD